MRGFINYKKNMIKSIIFKFNLCQNNFKQLIIKYGPSPPKIELLNFN